jgi:hypothetical protein
VLIGGAALSFGALLAAAGRPPQGRAAAPAAGTAVAGWAVGTFAGDLVVSLAQAWRETQRGPAGDQLVEISRLLQLRGPVKLTVTEAGTAPVVTGAGEAIWSVRTLTAFEDGRRREELRRGQLDGGELVLDAANVEAGAPRLLWQGATWRPSAFPSFTTTMYGPDGRAVGRFGDGMVAMRPADPLVLQVEWRSPDLIVASVEAESLRPPRVQSLSTQAEGPETGPGAQATGLRQTAAGTLTLLRELRPSAAPAATPGRPMP